MKKLILAIKQHPVFYFCLTAAYVLLNLLCDRNFFTNIDGWFDTNDSYGFMAIFILIITLVFLSFSAPFFLCAENGPSIHKRILKLWLPFGICITLQTIIFIIFNLTSRYFDYSILLMITFAIMGWVITFCWTLIVSALYFLSTTLWWYLLSVVAFFVSPIGITYGYITFFNSSNESLYLLNPVILPFLALKSPIMFIVVAAAVIGIFLLTMWLYNKVKFKLNTSLIYKIFKVIVTFLVSFSVGFLFRNYSNNIKNFTIIYSCVTVFTFIILLSYAFEKHVLMTISVITAMVVGVVAAIILNVTNGTKPNISVVLPPDSKEIDYVRISLDEIEEYRLDYSFSSCVDLHNKITELERGGYDRNADRSDPDCLADVWNRVRFNYTLKDGRTGVSWHDDLNDPVFDEFFIEYLTSDAYEVSFDEFFNREETLIIQYVSESPDNFVRELDINVVEAIIETYCDELDSANTSAFYEPYKTLLIENANGSGDRYIYIPISFTKTFDIIKKHMNLYTAY